MADHVFPEYVQNAIADAIQDGASLHYQSRAMPKFTTQEMLDHFVAPADHHVGYRACEMNGNAPERVYWNMHLALPTGWTSRLTFTLQPDTASPPFLWPSKPTKEWPTRDYSPRMEEIWSLLEHREMVAKEWAVVDGLLKLFDRSSMTLAGIKAFWPDLDLLFKLNSEYKRNFKLMAWCRKWRELGRPRYLNAPMADVRRYTDQARATILSTQFMERAAQDAPYHLQVRRERQARDAALDGTSRSSQSIEHRVP